MRFHSLVLSSAVEAPVIGLIYAPKVRGFMSLLGFEHLGLELSEVTKESLQKTLLETWNNSSEVQKAQQVKINELKKGARQAARDLREVFYADYKAPAGNSRKTVNAI